MFKLTPLLFMLIFSLAIASEFNGEFFVKTPQGVRPMALGNAFSAVSGDPLCAYWNPAGLSEIKDITLSSCHSNKFGTDVANDYIIYLYPTKTRGTFGLSYFKQSITEITVLSADPNASGVTGDDQQNFQLSYGYAANERISVGFNLKHLYQKNTASANAMECDASFQYHGSRYIDFGISFADWFPTDFTWSTGRKEKIPTSIKAGFLYRSPNNTFRASLDSEVITERDSSVRFGGEYNVNSYLSLRGGYEAGSEGGTPSLGFGLKHSSWSFDYTWNDTDLGSSSLFGATVAFDHPRKKKHSQRSEQLIGSELNEIRKEVRDEAVLEQKNNSTMEEIMQRYNRPKYIYGDAENAKTDMTAEIAVTEQQLEPAVKEHFELGNVYLLRKMYNKAIEEYLQVVTAAPGFAKVHFNLAAIYQKIDMEEKAIYEYRCVLKLEPDNLNALLALGNLYNSKGLSDKAVIYYNKVIILAPNSLQADVARKRLGNI